MHELHDAAVIECIARCRDSRNYRACLAQFVLDLQEARCWDQADAEEVGRSALRAINSGALQP
jgi:hypothetical protein